MLIDGIASRRSRRKAMIRAALRRFRKAEDGALIIFTLMLFVLMLMMGGLAVDLMRYESTRTALQQTIDRSTLAAASLTQDLEPVEVVKDYFDKAGLRQYLVGEPELFHGLNFREVRATARADVKPFFMQMMGINNLSAPAMSSAEQRITNVEIAMVLDISGSMVKDAAGNNLPLPNKLMNLKAAAREFVREVRSNDPEDRISISLVPYNGQVNLGTVLGSRYNVTEKHGVAGVNCVDLPAAAYNTMSLSTTLQLPNTGHVDTFSGGLSNGGTPTTGTASAWQAMVAPTPDNRWCPPNDQNIVRVHQNSVAGLEAQIQALTAVGATSINAGMRWGTALLDPGTRDVVSHLVGTNHVPALFDGRPFEYDDPEAMKVIVLMTDGSHFAEERLKPGFRSGLSPLYESNNDGNWSIFHASQTGTNKYWVPHRSEWRNAAWSRTTTGGTFRQLPWTEVWQRARLKWVAWQFYGRALGGSNGTNRLNAYNAAVESMRSLTPIADMDTQLQGMCNAAKSRNVVIFGIAFEAPAAGVSEIRKCSTSTSHFFDATDAEKMATAFRAIASQISYLRLTQ